VHRVISMHSVGLILGGEVMTRYHSALYSMAGVLSGGLFVSLTACTPSQQPGLSELAGSSNKTEVHSHVVVGGDNSGGESDSDSVAAGGSDAAGEVKEVIEVPSSSVIADPGADPDINIVLGPSEIEELLLKGGGCTVSDCNLLDELDLGISESDLTRELGQPIEDAGIVTLGIQELVEAVKANVSIAIHTSSVPFLPGTDPAQTLVPTTVVNLGREFVGEVSVVRVGEGEVGFLGKLSTGSFGGIVVAQSQGQVQSVISQTTPVLQIVRVTSEMAAGNALAAQNVGNLLVVKATSTSNLAPSAVRLATPTAGATSVSVSSSPALNLNTINLVTGMKLNSATGQMTFGP
jgi:hypothetical protein